jgi:nanoRNase/pAp phosphatase (c-di-AMP/oligoRNAs hydrolase)
MRICESEFRAFIRKYENVLYLCHRNADPDAIGSAFALVKGFGGTLGAVDDLSRTGENLAKVIGADVELNPRIADHDMVVVVDTSVRLQLGNINLSSYGVIDHHLDEGLLQDSKFYLQKASKSTAEIVWKILKESQVIVTKEMAIGLFVGMISDTGRFKRASSETFQAAAEILVKGGFDYEDALQILSVPSNISRKIAVLRAASRAKIERYGNWLIACTTVNSFEGSAATALVDLGADVAFVAGKHNDMVRISARSSREAGRSGLDLALILRNIAKAHGGEGGGHRAAAALEAKGNPCALLDDCRKRAIESLSN